MENSKQSSEQLLVYLMEQGYTVDIEAKGRRREYAFTYEVSARYNDTHESQTNALKLFTHIHATGENLSVCLEKLLNQIDNINNKLLPISEEIITVKCLQCEETNPTILSHGLNISHPEDVYLECGNKECDNWEEGTLPLQSFLEPIKENLYE